MIRLGSLGKKRKYMCKLAMKRLILRNNIWTKLKLMNGVMCHNLIFVEFKYVFLFIHEVKMSKLSYFGSTKSQFSENILS
jgi:hypothetical protein